MKKQEKKKWTMVNFIINHIQNNKKLYLIVGLIFLIGLIIGISFINNVNSKQNTEEYITNFINSLKNNYEIDKPSLLKNTIINDMILVFILWFMGSTVVGLPIVYLVIAYKGFSLGFTISCIIKAIGTTKGIIFTLSSMFLQNIVIIPCILALSVSGIKLYKSIMKDKRKQNIKIEIIRHTIFSLFIGAMLVLSAFIEVYASSNLLNLSIKFL